MEDALARVGRQHSLELELDDDLPQQDRPSEILTDKLFLGAAWHGHAAGQKGSTIPFTHVLNVSDVLVLKPGRAASGAIAAWVPLEDDGSSELFNPGGPWSQCRAFLQEAFAQPNSCVLIHCAFGVNRSATITAAYLMEAQRMSACRALAFLKERREVVSPVYSYRQQLQFHQQQLGISEGEERTAASAASWLRRLGMRTGLGLVSCTACWSMAFLGPPARPPKSDDGQVGCTPVEAQVLVSSPSARLPEGGPRPL